MAFDSLGQTNWKLAQNPELSDHNKEVLDDFLRKVRSGGAGSATLRDYSSRFNKLEGAAEDVTNVVDKVMDEIEEDHSRGDLHDGVVS